MSMFELVLLAPADTVDTLSEALDALDALSVSVEDADAQTPAELAMFGEPGMPPPKAGWDRSRVVSHFETEGLAREAAALFNQEKIGMNLAVTAVVAQTLLQERSLATANDNGWTDPWSRRDGWRSHGLTQRHFEFEFHAEKCAAVLTYLHDGALQLAVGDVKSTNGEIAGSLLTFAGTGPVIDLQFAGQRHRVNVYRQGEVAHVFGAAGATQITVIDVLAHAGDGAADTGRLTAPMPGKVVSFSV